VLVVLPELLAALGETGLMLLISVPIAVAVAIPVGVLLWATRPGGLRRSRSSSC
jgi:D-methionine transport system permease protein